jgi:signal transduction histidine kinase/ligand-binding sensor domain-containing protein
MSWLAAATFRRPLAPALAGMLLVCPCAFALDPALDVSQYAHTAWRIREGFTKGVINAIAQTPDGYLWLGTDFGLVRFDGVTTVPWQPPPHQQLPSTYISSLLAARDGTLWIGTLKGLARWKGGQLTSPAELAGRHVHRLLEDREGSVWVGVTEIPVGELCAIRNGNAKCYGEDGSLGGGISGLYEDTKGNLWLGLKDALCRWRPGPPKFYPLQDEPNGIRALGEDDDGALLIGMRGGVSRFVGGKIETYPLTRVVRPFDAPTLLRDRDGGLWIGTQGGGLVHKRGGRTDPFGRSDGLSGDRVNALFEDREGTVWIATPNGLDRFREFAVSTFSVSEGLSDAVVGSVLADEDGSVWLATYGGLNRWKDGHITVPLTGSGKRDGKLNGENPHSLFRDGRGRVWITTLGGVGYLESDRFFPMKGLPSGNVQGIAKDTGGNLWLANVNRGLFRLSPSGEVHEIPWAGVAHQDPGTALAADPLKGGLWLGFRDGGVAGFADGRVDASYGAADGLGQGQVNQLRFDPEGTLWTATEGGLSRLRDGRVATLAGKTGLPCDTVYWSVEDDAHAFWLLMACGLVRIARPELDAWATAADQGKNTNRVIRATVFNSADGVTANVGGYKPQVTKSMDGRVWFAGLDGVSVFDPAHLPFNKLPPPVHIEQVIADRKTYDATSAMDGRLPPLPPLVRDLQIDYTALSLVAPEKVRFRYKLEGRDRDWQDAGNRRQAFYSDLPPRTYRFRVTACNNSGVWNEAGTFLDFAIAPAYYQTVWFRIAGVAAILALLAALYQLRLRQVTQQMKIRMEGRLEERERIARDLHDTLLQSVQGLILKVDAAAKQIPSGEAARLAIEKTLDHADQVLAEGRDRVRNLRATIASHHDLPAAFQHVARESPQSHPVALKTVVEGRERELHPLVLEESYSIGREALINALTHSGAPNVEVEITYDPKQFRLRVRDDGRGVESSVLEEGSRSGHWGLPGMRERARKMGAEFALWSRPGSGTEIELTVPGTVAYRGFRDRPRRFWFRRPSQMD